MSDDERSAWVGRVLGVQIGGGPPPPPDTGERLKAAGIALHLLRDQKAPEAASLAARLVELATAFKGGRPIAAGALDALEQDIALATSAARARQTPSAPGRGVAYRKMLLRWREAQGLLDANIQALGKTLLAHPDIQADPRLDEIKQAVGALPSIIPQFGGALEDVLDAGMNASDPAELARLSAQGIGAIDAYRQQLASASQLLELESFAANDLGRAMKLHGALDEALVELKQQLAA